MPYLRLFLGERQLDEVFISDIILNSVIGMHTLEEEKRNMLQKHAATLKEASAEPVFFMESIPSYINYFKPLKLEGDNS